MTFSQEEVNAMAKESGARSEHWATRLFPAVQFLFTPEDAARFAELIASKEREICARYAECYDLGTPDGHDIAAAIRARGQKEGA